MIALQKLWKKMLKSSFHSFPLCQSLENHTENVHQKLVPDPLLILVNNPKQPLHPRNSFKSKILKEDDQKPFKKSTLYFLPNPIPFKGQSYQKQKGPGTSAQSLFRLQDKFRKILLLVISYLTKFYDVI